MTTDNYKKYAVAGCSDGGFLIGEADTIQEAREIGENFKRKYAEPYHINELTAEGSLKRRIY